MYIPADLLTASSASAFAVTNNLIFMDSIVDEKVLERVNVIRSAIDEIHMMEEILNVLEAPHVIFRIPEMHHLPESEKMAG